MVIYSNILSPTTEPSSPNPKTNLVALLTAFNPDLTSLKSPKSCASPSVAIVIKSIVLTLLGVSPPAKNPLVGDAAPIVWDLGLDKDPKV